VFGDEAPALSCDQGTFIKGSERERIGTIVRSFNVPRGEQNMGPYRNARWEPLGASRVTISLPRALAPITVNRYLIQKDRDQQLVL